MRVWSNRSYPFTFLEVRIQRAIAYFDSRNVNHALEDLSIEIQGYDYRKLADAMANGNPEYPKTLSIKMYGARYPSSVNIKKHQRDDAFYKYVENELKIKVCYGTFKTNEGVTVEKGVDVLLATDLILDSVYRSYDVAYIFSSDTDLLPAIKAALKMHKGKVIVCLNPKMRHLTEEFKKAGATPLLLGNELLNRFAPPSIPASKEDLQALVDKHKR